MSKNPRNKGNAMEPPKLNVRLVEDASDSDAGPSDAGDRKSVV